MQSDKPDKQVVMFKSLFMRSHLECLTVWTSLLAQTLECIFTTTLVQLFVLRSRVAYRL